MHCKTRSAAFYLILLLVLVATACGTNPPIGTHQKIVIISLDGMADWIFDYLLQQGRLPNIQKVLSHGVAADAAYTTFPALTAVGHASIWTGTDPSHNGIHSNNIIAAPYNNKTVLDQISGFDSTGLQAEPIWVTVARQGKKAVVVQATQSQPFEDFFGKSARFPAPKENLLIFDGYGGVILPADVIKAENGLKPAEGWINLPESVGDARSFSREIGDDTLHFLFFDDPVDPVNGLDTLWICSSEDAQTKLAALKPLPPDPDSAEAFSPPIDLTVNGSQLEVYFRLFSLDPQGNDFTLFSSQAHQYRSSDPVEEKRMNQQSGGFVGNVASRLYGQGFLGPMINDGGDGTAERALLETVHQSVNHFEAAMKFALKNYNFDLLIGYLPFPDELNHAWLGYVAGPDGGFDKPIGEKIKPFLFKSYQLVDEYVGTVLDNLPENTLLFVVSDHGFVSVDKWFFPNVAMKKAGLLFTDDNDMIDLTKTKAVYYPYGDDMFFVNTTEFKDGIVPIERKNEILAEVEQALLAVKDEQGNRIVEKVIYPSKEKELGMDGPYAGHLYIELAPEYCENADPLGDVLYSCMPAPVGKHFGDPRRRLMNSIFLVGKKTGAIDAKLRLVRSIDIAPAISSLLGIEPPKQASGKSLTNLVQAIEEASSK